MPGGGDWYKLPLESVPKRVCVCPIGGGAHAHFFSYEGVTGFSPSLYRMRRVGCPCADMACTPPVPSKGEGESKPKCL